MKTYTATPGDIEKKWVIVDAEGVVLGRLASIIANRLRGKHKATFTPHMDMGDNVIVINADKVQFTHGMNITVCTTAPDDEQARDLLRLLGFPFRDIPVVITLKGKEEA